MAKRRFRSHGELKNIYESLFLHFCIDTIPLEILGFPLARLIFNSELLPSSCDLTRANMKYVTSRADMKYLPSQ